MVVTVSRWVQNHPNNRHTQCVLHRAIKTIAGGALSDVVVDLRFEHLGRHRIFGGDLRTKGKVCNRGGGGVDTSKPLDSEVRHLFIHPCADLYRVHLSGLDLQVDPTNSCGEEESMSAFLGTVWFMLLLAAASFCAGMIFKTPFLKLITKGKYSG